MGDEYIESEFSTAEELFLLKGCLRDGMTPKEARKYVNALSNEVEKNHKKVKKK